MSTSGGIGTRGVLGTATVTIPAASIETLNSTPVQILAAPGAGKAIRVIQLDVEFKPGVQTYAAAGDGFGCYYAGGAPGSGFQASGQVDAALTSQAGVARLASANTSIMIVNDTRATNKAVNLAIDTSDPVRAAQIATSSLVDGGLGYATGDTGTIDGRSFSPSATYVVDTVDGLGTILTYHLVGVGGGYTTAANPHTTTAAGAQPGIGTGFTLNIDSLVAADGTLYATIVFETITTH